MVLVSNESSEFSIGKSKQRNVPINNVSMNERIAAFPSKTLYHNELISDPSVASHTLLDLETISNKDSDDAKDTLEHPVVFFDTAGCEFFERNEANDADGKGRLRLGEGSKSNENEASIVAKWARHLVSRQFEVR